MAALLGLVQGSTLHALLYDAGMQRSALRVA